MNKRKGMRNAYDPKDLEDARAMEDSADQVGFQFPDYASPAQTMSRGKIIEIIPKNSKKSQGLLR